MVKISGNNKVCERWRKQVLKKCRSSLSSLWHCRPVICRGTETEQKASSCWSQWQCSIFLLWKSKPAWSPVFVLIFGVFINCSIKALTNNTPAGNVTWMRRGLDIWRRKIKWSELGCETYSGRGRIEFGKNELAGQRNLKRYSDLWCDSTLDQSGGKKPWRMPGRVRKEYLFKKENFSLSLPLTFLTSCGNRWVDRKEEYHLDGFINCSNREALKRKIC